MGGLHQNITIQMYYNLLYKKAISIPSLVNEALSWREGLI